MGGTVFEALVIGGGINGLSAVYHFHRLGCKRIGLIERFRIGHDRGSSHGTSRITRSAYPDPGYVRLLKVVQGEEWPRLERDADRTLIHPSPGCFYGPPNGSFEEYARAVSQVDVAVEYLEVDEARRRFPMFRFENVEGVLHDRTSGLIAAGETISALQGLCHQYGTEVHEETQVLSVDPASDPIRVETNRGSFDAERLVITAGAWTSRLVPFLKQRTRVARQTVGYFKLAGEPEDYRLGRFPVWADLGYGRNTMYYGLPEFGREGIKVARHVIKECDDDPDEVGDKVDTIEIDRLRGFLEDTFVPPVERFVDSELCLYTNTETEDFFIDLHPENQRISIGAGFSGHGFKFGPLTGRVLAEMALKGKSSIPEFEEMRSVFAIDKRGKVKLKIED